MGWPAAVVFDFDGVIADSEPLHLRAFQRVLAEYGATLTPEDYDRHFLGYNDEDGFAAMAERYAIALDDRGVEPLVERKVALMPELLRAPDVLFSGAAESVRRFAQAVPLAIASGAKRPEIELVLDAQGLAGYFHAIVASGETARSKPWPDPYRAAVARLVELGVVAADLAPTRIVAIEDSIWGIESAQAAGLRCVAVATSYPPEKLTVADLVVRQLDDLTIDDLGRLVGAA
ncbi:MAG: HAD family phosphatase [Acidobacteria bacterium]|nr:HAD family phosphatase [Acidobacteriota bacterium]